MLERVLGEYILKNDDYSRFLKEIPDESLVVADAKGLVFLLQSHAQQREQTGCME